jgi:hypothetical protein
MNRRAFLAGLTLAASGLLLPERRFWFLDQTMVEPTFIEMFPNAAAHIERAGLLRAAAWEPTPYDEWLINRLRMEQAGQWVQNTTLEIPSWAEHYTRTTQKH